MSYMHIDNLYKNQEILMFRECYATEKIHGTSAHVQWKDDKVIYFAGGGNRDTFLFLFNEEELTKKFKELGQPSVIIYGECYGGKLQGMRETYGEKMKFVVFEVKIGDSWLCVPDAEKVVFHLGLEFVAYNRIPTTLEAIDAERDLPSVQSFRNGIIENKMREGIVLRPLIELRKNNGERIIAKHKRPEFSETAVPKKVTDPTEVEIDAQKIADNWVTEMRLTHVLDLFPGADITKTGEIIKAMIADVAREAKGEITMTREAVKKISQKTAMMFKQRLQATLKEVK